MERDVKKADVLAKGIQDYLDGNYENPRNHRPGDCKHGTPYYQACERCVDIHFEAVLKAAEATP